MIIIDIIETVIETIDFLITPPHKQEVKSQLNNSLSEKQNSIYNLKIINLNSEKVISQSKIIIVCKRFFFIM